MAKTLTKRLNGRNPFPHLIKQKCKEQGATKRRRKKAMAQAKKMQRDEWI
jgi:hypothetical protein